MARIAEEAGFKAVYMSGGSLGWLKCVTEANITLPEMVEIAVDIRAVCRLPIILDAGGGWGDPMHVHRTIALTEAAGFAAIEIEDQLLPRRVEHHIGIDNLVDTGHMVDKIMEAIAARTDPNLVIVARTNTRRVHGLDDALRRGDAFHRAGADMLFIYTRDAEEMRFVGERLPAPLMTTGIFAASSSYRTSSAAAWVRTSTATCPGQIGSCRIGNVNLAVKTGPIPADPRLFRDGETSVGEIYEAIGGGGANCALAIAQMKGRVHLCAAVGEDALGHFDVEVAFHFGLISVSMHLI